MLKFSHKKTLLLVLIAGLLLRVFLIPVARHGDLNNNISWGQELLTRGPANFYEHEEWPFSAPNQPPLYIWVFGATSVIQNTAYSVIHSLNQALPVFPSPIVWWFEQWGELYIAKIPGIIADLGIAYVVYRFVGGKKGLLLSAVWMFNPMTWYNSAIWGGTDGIVNMLGLFALVSLANRRLLSFSFFITLSILFKGSLLIFLPFLTVYIYVQKYPLKQWMHAAGVGLLTFLFVTILFHPQGDVLVWFFNLYTERFLPGEIGSLTANAFNVWWLVDPGKTLDSHVFIGLPARVWGILWTLLIYLLILIKTFYRQKSPRLFLPLAIIALTSFMLMTRIHERYLYPFFPLATIALSKFKWLWIPYLVLSIAHLMNLYHLFWAPGNALLENAFLNPSLMIWLSILNVGIFVYILKKYVNSV